MSGQSGIILFPDTNFFLECRDPAECPWKEITDADEITLAVCRSVRSEIDKHKSGKDRLASRARKWTSRFREASRATRQTTLRETNPRIILWVPAPVHRLTTLPDLLDVNRPDDRIIADILALRAVGSVLTNVALFTDDGAAADTARHIGLDAIDVPLDEEDGTSRWRLPKEPDGAEKRMRELEARIQSLSKQVPIVIIRAFKNDGAEVNELPLEIVRFPSLSTGAIEQLAMQAEAANPKATDFGKVPAPATARQHHFLDSIVNMMQTWKAPSDAEIAKYVEKDYPGWQEAIRSFYRELHVKLEMCCRAFLISVSIQNDGTVPAENAMVTFEALGGLVFAEVPKKDDNNETDGFINLTLPAAPKPPRGSYVAIGGLAQMGDFEGTRRSLLEAAIPRYTIENTSQRERTKFYWRDQKSAVRWQAECAELRHKIEPATFPFLVYIRPDREPTNPAIRCTVTASNLPMPAISVLKVPITFIEGNTEDYAIRILHAKGQWRVCVGEKLPARIT